MIVQKSIEAICSDMMARDDAWQAVRSGRSYVPLLPLLEHPHAEVSARLADCLTAAGISRAEAAEVSLAGLVAFALTADMGRGCAIDALKWVISDFPINDEIATGLEHLARQHRFPQQVRHQAFGAAKRWRRAHHAAVTGDAS
jgi:hypothetical protein